MLDVYLDALGVFLFKTLPWALSRSLVWLLLAGCYVSLLHGLSVPLEDKVPAEVQGSRFSLSTCQVTALIVLISSMSLEVRSPGSSYGNIIL